MRKRIFIALVLIMMLVPLSIAAKPINKQLRFETSYDFVCSNHRPDPKGEGRTHAWTGTVNVDGLPVGTMDWWMFMSGIPEPPMVSHWENGYWEINIDGEVITGYESGSTTFLPNWKGAYWRANGYVDIETGDYAYLYGNKIHDGGNVTMLSPFPPCGPTGPTWSGTGQIHINK